MGFVTVSKSSENEKDIKFFTHRDGARAHAHSIIGEQADRVFIYKVEPDDARGGIAALKRGEGTFVEAIGQHATDEQIEKYEDYQALMELLR